MPYYELRGSVPQKKLNPNAAIAALRLKIKNANNGTDNKTTQYSPIPELKNVNKNLVLKIF
jgi:hypothetical protein